MRFVAPRAGAWIETVIPGRISILSRSPPARGATPSIRRIDQSDLSFNPRPRAGAWIETKTRLRI